MSAIMRRLVLWVWQGATLVAVALEWLFGNLPVVLRGLFILAVGVYVAALGTLTVLRISDGIAIWLVVAVTAGLVVIYQDRGERSPAATLRMYRSVTFVLLLMVAMLGYRDQMRNRDLRQLILEQHRHMANLIEESCGPSRR